MPPLLLDHEYYWEAEKLYWARCCDCRRGVNWRHHKGLVGIMTGTCCHYVFEAAYVPAVKPVYRIKVQRIEFAANVLRFPAMSAKARG